MVIQVSSHLQGDLLESNLSISADYNWIFDELQDPDLPGTIEGDDVVFWGEDMGPYYNSAEIKEKLMAAEGAFPDYVTYFEYGSSYFEKPLMGVRITAPASVEVYAKSEVLIVAAMHGTEAVTVMDALILMDSILYGIENLESWAITAVEQNEIYILPLFNPDALDYTYINPWQRVNMQPFDGDQDGTLEDELEIGDVNGDYFVASYTQSKYEGTDLDGDGKTGEDFPGGIDLGRNYDYKFALDDIGSSSDSNRWDFRGEYAYQAPETDQFADFARNHHFYTSISLHSGLVCIFPPWAYNASKLTPHYEIFDKIIEGMQELVYFPTWNDVGGYLVNGQWGDWMYGELDSLALTIETYVGVGLRYHLASWIDTWQRYNPDANQIYNISSQNVLKHLKYSLTIPRLSWIQDEYRIDLENMIAENVEDTITVILNYTMTPDEVNTVFYMQLEKFNEQSMSWDSIESEVISSDLSTVSITADINADDEWRVYVGSKSRGFSYHFDLIHNERINIEFDANQPVIYDYSEITQSTTSAETTESPVSIVFVIIPLALIPILRRKYLLSL
jgi:hypothetical protein